MDTENHIKILDHGFIRVVDKMGDDSAIVQAARVSYGSGTKKVNEDRALIRYLLRNKHTTPFEMCEIKFHIKAPIFVARQWIRHRTANVNEYSARYSVVDNEFYIPEENAVGLQSELNKQGRDTSFIEDEVARGAISIIKDSSEEQYAQYQKLLEQGISREIARLTLTLNFYTEFYWKIDLHNLMHFLRLRAHHHAQYEIRVYALAMMEIMKEWVPLAHAAFMEYSFESYNFSKTMIDILKTIVDPAKIKKENFDLSKREWNEFYEILEIKSD